MCNRFSSSVGLAFASLVLFLGALFGTAASAQSLTASVATDRGCGATALYNLGESNQIRFSVSQNASVTLRWACSIAVFALRHAATASRPASAC